MATKLKIGLVGLGCVGKGLVSVLSREKNPEIEVLGICVKDGKKDNRAIGVPILTDFQALLHIPEIEAIVEVTNDPDFAWEVAKLTLRAGKDLVTANKAMVSTHLPDLITLQQESGARVLFDASVAANIPILQNLETWFDHDWLVGIRGVLNGTSNFILERIQNDHLSYPEALQLAIEAGFAEKDPSADVWGWDARHKLNILATQAFGVWTPPGQILAHGIDGISEADVQFARHRGWRIRQVAIAQKWGDSLFSAVLPSFVSSDDPLFQLEDAFNGIVLTDGFGETHFFKGKGAGGETTGAAIYADLKALTKGFRYSWGKFHRNVFLRNRESEKVDIYYRYDGALQGWGLEFLTVYEKHLVGSGGWILGQTTLEALRRNLAKPDRGGEFISLLPPAFARPRVQYSIGKKWEG